MASASASIRIPRRPTTRTDVMADFTRSSDIREVVAYAAARHITIVPEIEMPGHSSAALMAYPQFVCPNAKIAHARQRAAFSPVFIARATTRPLTFSANVLSEVASLFPGKYIHIGGDEVMKSNWKHCAECQARIKH